MELPNYRFPSAKSVWQLIVEKAKNFAKKAFTSSLGLRRACLFYRLLAPELPVQTNAAVTVTNANLDTMG